MVTAARDVQPVVVNGTVGVHDNDYGLWHHLLRE